MEPAHTTIKDTRSPSSVVQEANAGTLLQARNLGLQGEGRWVWRRLDLAITPGERVGLTGPSGSGKTALMRILAGLMPATEGDILLEQRALPHWPMPEYRSRIGYLAQRPELGDGATVEAVLNAPFTYRSRRHQAYPRQWIEQALETLGRDSSFLQRPVASLSGGEQQIAALLRLLALQPSIVLLDEPTAALDTGSTRQLESLLDAWQHAAPDRSWLWTSHDGAQLERMSTRTLALPWNP
ncbi:ABC transporter ATP-binding protein [Marinobacterium rhizophilum]|uniref:ATP-binding cassette domain-containing protein n=1 Tax=Marinobacterium rhizophilum TaxID=420402 RepID=A0ABY5HGN0_9GAMM|nr:ATP-binding cassette domain-containing protein [Marinobacterium rhizophilum]UTW11517.1 ATP-binding cassette domain-containing protein [Marinobacterium rhizophilum]